MLLYKEQISSPYGDLSLFNKMEKIKLASLILQEKVNINGLKIFKGSVFALNNDYEKEGRLGSKSSERFHFFYDDPRKK